MDAVFRCELLEEPDVLGGAAPDGPQTGVEWVPLEKLTDLRLLPSASETCFLG
ncbi:hypothetical protein [Streptomyces syringium]|uniref:hypothetical protein n=1 Tax=Streptomyces syringium TaxID=76729 RepID=UPI0033D71954